MTTKAGSIPRPLVRANQSLLVVSVLICWLLAIWTNNSFWVLLIPLLSGLSGLIFGFNPVMMFARLFLKKKPNAYAQEDAADQRFNQILASSMLGLAFFGFLFGYPLIGYLFSAFVFAAALVALLGFCVGCFIRFQFLKYRAARQKGAAG